MFTQINNNHVYTNNTTMIYSMSRYAHDEKGEGINPSLEDYRPLLLSKLNNSLWKLGVYFISVIQGI